MGLFSRREEPDEGPKDPSRRWFLKKTGIAAAATLVPSLASADTSEMPPGISHSKYKACRTIFNLIMSGERREATFRLMGYYGDSNRDVPLQAYVDEPAVYYLFKLANPREPMKFETFKDANFNHINAVNPGMIPFFHAIDKYMTTFYGGLWNYATPDQIIEDAAKGYVLACGRSEGDWKELVKAIETLDTKSPTLKFVDAPIKKKEGTMLLTAAWSGYLLRRTLGIKYHVHSFDNGRILVENPSGFVLKYIENQIARNGIVIRGPPKNPGLEDVGFV